MPELGIGAVHGIYLASHPNCLYPTDVEASSRWFAEDVIDPPIVVTDGTIELPPEHVRAPTVNMDVVERYSKRSRTMKF